MNHCFAGSLASPNSAVQVLIVAVCQRQPLIAYCQCLRGFGKALMLNQSINKIVCCGGYNTSIHCFNV